MGDNGNKCDDAALNTEEKTAIKSSSATSARDSRGKFHILESQGYTVGEILGSGSYGCVRSAFDTKRKKNIAIKIISKRKSSDEFLTKFLPREIDAIKTLRHPSLIQHYQVIETTSRYFLIMELGSADLLGMIRKQKQIEESQSGVWFSQIHDGLTYMHQRKLVHRDLKCENVIIDDQRNVKITDFGFAKKMDQSKKLSDTFCGSYAYASPEVLKGISYDPFLSDVWSCGVVLFTMVYGRLPFDDANHKQLLKLVQIRITFPVEPEVSEDCRKLLLKILVNHSERLSLDNIRFEPWYKKVIRERAKQQK